MKIWKYDITWEKFRGSIEYRSVAFIFRVFAVFLMISYVYIGGESFFMLVKKDINRRQDITALPAVIREAVEDDRLGDVTAWVKLRPAAETDEIIRIVTTESGSLETSVFLELSRRRIKQDKIEDALFWVQLSRYRLRYDLLRCGRGDSIERIGKFLALFPSPRIEELLRRRPALVKESIRQVLDFDKKYPAVNSPALMCKAVNGIEGKDAPPVPREHWENIRRTLRETSETALKGMDGK